MKCKKEKKDFKLYVDSLQVIKKMTDEEAGQFLRKCLSFWEEDSVEVDRIIELSFESTKAQFERDWKSYQSICERNKENGLKPKKPVAPSRSQSKPDKPIEADTDTDTEKDKDKEKRRHIKKFTPPTVEEIKNYSIERGYEVDAEKIFNHYDVADWKDVNGKQVKNWKQKISTIWFKPEYKVKNYETMPFDELVKIAVSMSWTDRREKIQPFISEEKYDRLKFNF